MNLLSNANKFTREGRINIYCRMADNSSGIMLSEGSQDPYSHLVVFVEDQGIGISKGDQKKLFKPFCKL
jgi:signal transduction histidine kinase